MSKLMRDFLRRSFALGLCFVVLCFFTACEKEKKEDLYQSLVPFGSSTHLRTKNYYVYATTMVPTISDESSVEVELPYGSVNTVKRRTGKIAPLFVTYEDICIAGQFMGYGMMGMSSMHQFLLGDIYTAYILQDGQLSKVELHIIHTGQEGLGEEEHTIYGLPRLDSSCVAPDSKMRTLLEGYVGGFVDVEGVRYIYTHGKLQGIKWVHAGFEFILREFEDYPADCTYTFIGKLLDPALVGDAISLFNQQFDIKREARQ